MLYALKNQLLQELRASWKKTAILAVLLVVGSVFWLPLAVRAIGSGASSSAGPAAPQPASSVANPAAPVVAPTVADAQPTAVVSPDPKTPEPFTWQRGQKLLQSDPLVRSVEVAAIQGDPFLVDPDQFPPPVVFEREAPAEIKKSDDPAALAAMSADARAAEKLVLKSTIVGLKRRAAYINDKLYFEGREIQVDGESWMLSAVRSRRVVLTRGEAVLELVLPSAFETEATRHGPAGVAPIKRQ